MSGLKGDLYSRRPTSAAKKQLFSPVSCGLKDGDAILDDST
jgi:hypothetical protein